MSAMLDVAKQKLSQMQQSLSEFVAFPSVSNDPDLSTDWLGIASAIKAHLSEMGLSGSRVIETIGNPLVFAEHISSKEAPTILFYGHYDVVKPGDPQKWASKDPFKLTEESGRLYGRGAQDNKGQITYVLEAIRYLIKQGGLACNVKIILEGEEEIGSKALIDKLENDQELRNLVKSNMVFACDTDAPESGNVGLTLGLRGSTTVNIKVTGANRNTHSGMYGGVTSNPIIPLSQALGSLLDSDLQIIPQQFRDSVRQASPDEVAAMIASGESQESLSSSLGMEHIPGEQGISTQERIGCFPAIEVTYFNSGQPGLNSIPCEATARIAARTVPNQDPKTFCEALQSYLREKINPKLFKVEFFDIKSGDWLLLRNDGRAVTTFAESIQEVTGKPAAKMYCGGSIPVLAKLIKLLNADTVLPGVGRPEDQIHDFNESISPDQLAVGFATVAQFLLKLK